MRINTRPKLNFRTAKFLVPLLGLSFLQAGCTSITLAGKGGAPGQPGGKAEIVRGASERQALQAAVLKLDQTPWPQIEKISFSARMTGSLFGGDQAEAQSMTRDRAIEIYLNRLNREGTATARLLSDADATLAQARQVAESGRLAARAMRPQSDDIKVLESAIAEVRASRNIYLAVMKRLKKQGTEVPREDISDIKNAFSQTMRDIGLTANVLSERLAAEKTLQDFAQSKVEPGK